MVDFLFIILTFFTISYGWDVISGNLSKLAFFEGVTLNADFRWKGASPTKHGWCQKTRVIALLCCIKISAVHCLVLSQSTRVTFRRTHRQTEGQNYDSQDCSNIAVSHSKNERGHIRNWKRGILIKYTDITDWAIHTAANAWTEESKTRWQI